VTGNKLYNHTNFL